MRKQPCRAAPRKNQHFSVENSIFDILERYSEGEEQGLKPESDRKLRKMLRFHLRDRLTSGLAAGSQTNGQNLATGSANFRVTHRTINALLEGLKDLNGDPTVK